MPITAALEEIYRPIETPLRHVRARVGMLWDDALQLVHGDGAPRTQAGGKMLRPALCLLSAGAIGAPTTEPFVPMATAMELLHMAALAHDDVVDEADTRRGVQSLRARWDSHTAVLGGDYLVARAIEILGEYNRCSVIVNAIESVREMAEGELVHFGNGPGHFTLEGCLNLARKKTASLFAVSCSTPTRIIDTPYRDALHAFGAHFGAAFQLTDDVLDLCQSAAELGKPSCGDIAEGKRTAPLLFLREALDPAGLAHLDAMTGRPVSEDDRAWIHTVMETTGARERTEALARSYCEQARASLEALAPTAYRDAMFGLTEYVLVRPS